MIPSVAWNAYQLWPPRKWGIYFIAGGALIAYIFVSFGLGIEPAFIRAYSSSKPTAPEDSAEA
jgi:hypothetical protein